MCGTNVIVLQINFITMNRSDKTLLALIIGAATGLVAGLLFAPDKGKKTRKKISVKANELRDEIKEGIDSKKIKKMANEALSEVEKYGQKFSDLIKD